MTPPNAKKHTRRAEATAKIEAIGKRVRTHRFEQDKPTFTGAHDR
jgi:hypothetical protein